jgi:hypothetical protein
VSTLVCQTLNTELSQEINYNSSERLHIGCISPYLLLVNSPVGTFTLEMTGPNGVVFSKAFSSNDIKSSIGTVDDFAHVFYPVIPDYPIQIESGNYTIKLTASGYSASGTSFIGWIQQHENIQNEMTYIPVDDSQNSFSIRFKSYKEGSL